MPAKVAKLWIHRSNFKKDDLVINHKDFPDIAVGDLLEIYHPQERTHSHLLLQVTNLHDDFQQKDTVSIEQSVATAFHLRAYNDICISKLAQEEVTLDMLEMTFKDQFVSRSDMWRMQMSLIGSCVYKQKKVHFCGIRAQVNDMWANGDKVTCGYVGADTKVVFRSQSAQIHLFVQMCAEMWEFDFFGLLYFEKAVNGFLSELFQKWHEMNSSHEVTIVFFSRTFYDGCSPDEFPKEMRGSLNKSTDGRMYQDFYKVIFHSEKMDDWGNIIVTLKQNFNSYLSLTGCSDDDIAMVGKPHGTIARACEGNMLEAINISLNVFDRRHVDCNLELANHSTVIITPSSGVFEVSRELTTITKQRLTDSGVGADLVCLAEQPLHAVPLFRFPLIPPSKGQSASTVQYNIPQWVNHSFFTSTNDQSSGCTFVPRMKVPEKPLSADRPMIGTQRQDSSNSSTPRLPDIIDFDEYDANVFSYATPRTRLKAAFGNRAAQDTQGTVSPGVRSPTVGDDRDLSRQKSWDQTMHRTKTRSNRAMSDVENSRVVSSFGNTASEDSEFCDDSDENEIVSRPRNVVGSASMTQYCGPHVTGLINPFKPYYIAHKMTVFRHRWLHAFPKGPKGEAMQEHHRKVTVEGLQPVAKIPAPEVKEAALATVQARKQTFLNSHLSYDVDSIHSHQTDDATETDSCTGSVSSSAVNQSRNQSDTVSPKGHKLDNFTSEHDWTTAVMTGVDWKSLSIPACLPLTTDYVPDERELGNNQAYAVYFYTLFLKEIDAQRSPQSISFSEGLFHDAKNNRMDATFRQTFFETISQRMGQGFQFITNKKGLQYIHNARVGSHYSFDRSNASWDDWFALGYGQDIHRVCRLGNEMHVDKYIANHKREQAEPFEYRYKLWPSTLNSFYSEFTEFSHVDMGTYNWNYLDQYVTQIDSECNQLTESLKYWRARFLVLPIRKTKEADSKEPNDLVVLEGFLRFLESLNKLRRPQSKRKLFSCRVDDSAKAFRRSATVASSSDGCRSSEENSRSSSPSPMTTDDLNKQCNHEKDTKSTPVKITDTKQTTDHSEPDQLQQLHDRSSSLDDATKDGSSPVLMPPEHALTSDSPLRDIVAAMKDESYGLSFIPVQSFIGEQTFVSAEAVAWLLRSVDHISTTSDAISFGQRLLNERHILPCSYQQAHFIDGFHLYYIPEQDSKGKEIIRCHINCFEVATWRDRRCCRAAPVVFLNPDLDLTYTIRRSASVLERKTSTSERKPRMQENSIPEYKTLELNVDINQRSDRAEWCTVFYLGNLCPTIDAFAIELHWMVATGCLVSELVQTWSRRATSCGFHIVPAPVCPFPIENDHVNKDPLHRVSFIPLNLDSLVSDEGVSFLDAFERDTLHRRICFMQEAILIRFGFVKDFPMSTSEMTCNTLKRRDPKSYQYVHWSGALFVRVVELSFESPDDAAKAWSKSTRSPTNRSNKDEISSLLDTSKQVNSAVNELMLQLEPSLHVGFSWTFNNAMTKKWRSSYTGDNDAARNLMKNLSDFCSNQNNQLVEFWKESVANYNTP